MNTRGLFPKVGFRTKITVSIISILLLLAVGLSIVMNRLVSGVLLSESKVRGISSAVNLAARVGEPMLSIDFLQLKNIVDEAVQTNKDTAYAFVLDKDSSPLVHTFSGGFPVELRGVNVVADSEACHVRSLTTGSERIYDFAAPVFIGGDRIGTVRIGMSLTRVQEVVGKLMLAILLSVGIGILIVGLVSTGLARTV